MQAMTAVTRSLADCAQVVHAVEVVDVVGTDGKWLSTTEAAAVIGCSKGHVIHLVDTKELAGTKVGTHRRILRSVAEAYRDKLLKEAGGQSAVGALPRWA